MILSRRAFTALSLAAPAALAMAGGARALARDPLVIASGAASGDAPAGTRGAYELAIRDGADILAASFHPTRDGALVARADHELSATTDIASRPEFAARRQSRFIDGRERIGWFVEDFTLAELKTLVCVTPGARRRSGAVDAAARAILTFEEVIAVARAGSVRTARVIGVEAGISHSAYNAGLDLAVEPRVAAVIRSAGYNAAAAAMWVASDEREALAALGELTRARRVFRLAEDAPQARDRVTAAGLATVRTFAEAIAPDAELVLDLATPKTIPPTSLVADAHAAGLAVQAWTVDRPFPPAPFRSADGRRLLGALFAAGCEAVCADQTAQASRARDDANGRDRG